MNSGGRFAPPALIRDSEMELETNRRAEKLFKEAITCEPAARRRFVDQHCPPNSSIRAELESLLRHYEASSSFLENPCESSPGAAAPGEAAATIASGTRIGSYRILDIIGEGGMGVVYRAEQDNPRRTVALKVIRRGLASPALLRRFDLEARVLGCLQHPGIAQIFEAGTATENGVGQPFFAMELVDGPSLTDYALLHRLGLRQRLELLARVCDAVQHAHQKGVIHRDLKPVNILVDSAGQPKILDFGVARLTDADTQPATLQTDAGQIVGTIAYMSPEQIAGDSGALDTRSDVYALGVLGFELLAGRSPHDLHGKSLPDVIATLREKEPLRLGTANRACRGDLETIISKAMEKDRERRYSSASELAADLRRFLRREPITARPPSATYQLRKMMSRHKLPFTFAALLFLVVTVFAVFGTYQALTISRQAGRITEERDNALRQARIARAVNDFLNNDLLASVDPEQEGHDVRVQQILAKASQSIREKFGDEPLVRAAILQTLGNSYRSLGDYEIAQTHLSEALELHSDALGPENDDTLSSMYDLATLYHDADRLPDAEPLYSKESRTNNLKDSA